jgi:hypothetical protein
VTLANGAAPGFVPTYVYDGIALSNTGDQLSLSCAGVLVDTVSYGGSTAGASRSLDPSIVDAAQNDDDTNWCPGASRYNGDLGTPGGHNPTCP